MERKEIAENKKWNTQALFESDEAWEKEFQAVEKEYGAIDFSAYDNRLGEKDVLLACLSLNYEVARRIEKLYIYAHLRHDEDVRNADTTAALARITSLYSKLLSQFAFVDPQLTALDEKTLQGFINDPDFKDHDYKLRKLVQSKAHVLSEQEERLLALSSDVFGGFQDVFMMLDNANLNLPKANFNGEEVQMSHGMYGVVLHTGSDEERKEWFEKYYDSYIKLIDAITQTYYNNVKKNVLYKTVRKYDSCLEMALDEEDVSPIVYENLIKATHDALPSMHEYISVRQKLLGKEQHIYDVYVPLVEDADMKLPFDEAYDLVIKGLGALGSDYQALLEKARKERWIDVYENVGKRNGAYSAGAYDSPHPYVLLNYQPTTNDIFTIAHEMGHAMHTYKSKQAQPQSKASYTIFLAEIASTVNEVLLLKYLYKESKDKNLKKYLLNYYMDTIRATLFRQTQFAEFEHKAHEQVEKGEAITKDSMCQMYYALNKQYYGEGLVHDKQIAYEWARIPHFYNAFYVYKYATGIISAMAIVKRILKEGESAVKDYFEFLSAGGSDDPVSILKKAGVDLTTEAPFKAAMEEFADTLNEFKSLLD